MWHRHILVFHIVVVMTKVNVVGKESLLLLKVQRRAQHNGKALSGVSFNPMTPSSAITRFEAR